MIQGSDAPQAGAGARPGPKPGPGLLAGGTHLDQLVSWGDEAHKRQNCDPAVDSAARVSLSGLGLLIC